MSSTRRAPLAYVLAGLLFAMDTFASPGPAHWFKGAPTGEEIIATAQPHHERAILELVNYERRSEKLTALVWDADLALAARYHAADMAVDGYFKHESYDRRSDKLVRVCDPWTRIRAFAREAAGENILTGPADPAAAVRRWMASPPHRRNILRPGLRRMGAGYYDGRWVQVFGTALSQPGADTWK